MAYNKDKHFTRKVLKPKRHQNVLDKDSENNGRDGFAPSVDGRNSFKEYMLSLHSNRECATQTSNTLLPFKPEKPMSPDSLSNSPRITKNKSRYSWNNMNVAQRNISTIEQNYEETEQGSCLTTQKPLTDGSLIGSYLSIKNNVKVKSDAIPMHQQVDYPVKRSDFLLQTSPLRHIMNAKAPSSSGLKSQSFVETNSQKKYVTAACFNVRDFNGMQTNGAQDHSGKWMAGNPYTYIKKSSTFMLPTISSEQKNQMPKIKSVNSLVSPIRRGRSVSPRSLNKVGRSIPYIDQSQSDTDPSYYAKRKLNKSPPFIDIHKERKAKNVALEEKESESTIRIGLSTSVSSVDNTALGVLHRVKNTDWNIALKGLAEVLEICKMDIELIYDQLPAVNQRIIQLLKSPRSHVCRTTCQVAGNMFEFAKDTRRPEFDEMVDILLCKTADSNKFIRHDANLALDCMVTHVPFIHSFRALTSKGPDHKNSLVRIATVRLLVCAIVILDPSVIFQPSTSEMVRKKIMETMMKFVVDKNVEARKYGERLYKILSRDPSFALCLKKHFEKAQISEMKKSLKSLVYQKK